MLCNQSTSLLQLVGYGLFRALQLQQDSTWHVFSTAALKLPDRPWSQNNSTRQPIMFGTPVIVVYVPRASLCVLQACAVPVLRAHQHDDVLPDLPEGTELLPQYTLLRPATEWSKEVVAWTADAAGCFEPAQQHAGLVVTASHCCSRQLTSSAGVLHIGDSGYNR